MRIVDAMLAEIEMESKTTRKFLEAMPADQMGFKPHEKSMSAGELAMHVATLPGVMAEWGKADEYTMPAHQPKPQPTKDEILAAFEKSLTQCRDIINTFDDQKMMGTWNFMMNGKAVMSMPRVAFLRSWMLNHMYHHRGQFGVYLRLMGAKVPASYGPSADENPMAKIMEMAAQA